MILINIEQNNRDNRENYSKNKNDVVSNKYHAGVGEGIFVLALEFGKQKYSSTVIK